MKILFVSDYVCPYCLAAKEAMLQAVKELGITPEITWHPFELTVEPAPRVDTYHDEVRKAHYQVLKEPCRKLGLDMKLPPAVVPRPYSRLAFEGYFYAEEQGKGEAYNDLMYRAYFIDEKDIGDPEILCGLAEQAGLDRKEYRRVLEQGIYSEKLKEADRHAREDLHVTHVPTIYVDGTEVSVKEYTKEEFAAILGQSGEKEKNGEDPEKDSAELQDSSEKENGSQLQDAVRETDREAAAAGCGPDGCSVF